MNKSIPHLIFALMLAGSTAFAADTSSTCQATGYFIPTGGAGTKCIIDEHSAIRDCSNSNATGIFAPTRTAAEWTGASGFLANIPAGVSCATICAPGYGGGSCTGCGPGTWDSVAGGSEACAACPAGTYSTGANNKTCTPCLPGQAQPLTGQTSCTVCGTDTISNAGSGVSGSTGCSACTSGNFALAGLSACTPCTNKPVQAISATYSGVGGGTNSCPYTSVTCNTCYLWNSNTTVAGALCNPGTPGPPTGLSFTPGATCSGSFASGSASWTAPPMCVTGYNVYITGDGFTTWLNQNQAGTSISYPDFDCDTYYEISVRTYFINPTNLSTQVTAGGCMPGPGFCPIW